MRTELEQKAYDEGVRDGIAHMRQLDDESAVMDRLFGNLTDDDLTPRQAVMYADAIKEKAPIL